MNKVFLLLLISIFIIGISTTVDAEDEECFPSYECGDWTPCENGFKTRACKDTNCGNRDIVERGFCSSPKCTPQIECGEWGPCTYTEKTDSLIMGEVNFGGYRTRLCDDLNDCIPRYYQEGPCEDSYQLKLSPIEECGQNLLAVIDPSSDRKIAKINLDRWKQGKFDLSFVQGEKTYCPSCYNAVKDENEEKIDCGGPCKECGDDRIYLLPVAITFLWISSVTFIFLSFRQIVQLKREQINPQEQ